MSKMTPLPLRLVVTASLAFAAATAARGETMTAQGNSKFVFKDSHGNAQTVPVVSKYYPKKLQIPAVATGKVQRGINPTLMRAATIAQERAHAHSGSRCWQYVKEALLAAGAVSSYPKTAYAKDAGQELVNSYGFKKLGVRDPYQAPVGSVIVYGASRAAGHVEIRTKDGFVSDFRSKIPSHRPLLGVYAKG
jgi:hypothetical protein